MKLNYIKNTTFRKTLPDLLASAERLIGLPVCINDDLDILGLPYKRRIHSNPFCMAVKKDHHPDCIAFCRWYMDKLVLSGAGGMKLTCPFGGLQFVAPIFIDGMFVSTLFAGPHCFANDDDSVKPGKIRQGDLRNLVASLARDISSSVSRRPERSDTSATRYNRIISYVYENISQGVSIDVLAGKLHLSPCRTSHCVKEVTGMDFTSLVNSIRRTRSVRLLLGGNMSMAEIALELGFCDQSHFTKFFKQNFGITPNRYRHAGTSSDVSC